ncbi:MAG: hypothetical protein CVU73_12470 [Deltaproteobacteria bacterium HGW-Deltaproteobacteria-8]|jgi:hypothetical protein|nr:MAG: hypothetical protein CVU73_12470 [Deltaproteobacteria bacterium HGW-Deltaproteobacteria-8]
MNEKNLPLRLRNFVVTLGAMLTFTYVLLPMLTSSCGILNRMSLYLNENGIDPTRYYYTDVEQVKESEQYLDEVLNKK